MNLDSYSNLITLAVGLCFAYVFINHNDNKDQFFLKYLKELANNAINRISEKKTEELYKFEFLIPKLKFYIENEELNEAHKGAAQNILNEISKTKKDVSNIEDKLKQKINTKTTVKHLGKISFVSGLYGIALLVTIGLPKSIDTVPFIFTTNILVVLFSIICIISEWNKPVFDQKWSNHIIEFIRNITYPTFSQITVFILFYIILIFLLYCCDSMKQVLYSVMYFDEEYILLVSLSLISLFIGFVGYATVSFIYVNYIVSLFSKGIKQIDIKGRVKVFNSMYHAIEEVVNLGERTLSEKVLIIEDFRIE